jgi:putative sterol carrier protein
LNDQPAQIDPENLDPQALSDLVQNLDAAALNDLVKGLDTEAINKLVRASDPETAKALLRKVDPGTFDLSTIDPGAIDADVFDPDVVAIVVGSTPEEKLKEAMSGPLREVIVGEVFRRMPERLNSGAAATADAVINWEIANPGGEPDRYTVRVQGGNCTVEPGHDPSPRVSLQLDAVTFLRLVTGNLNPVTAFMAGQITITGDLMFAASVTALFDIPSGAPQSGSPAQAT